MPQGRALPSPASSRQFSRNRDTAWYSIIDRDWPAIKAAFEAWLDPTNFDSSGREKKKLAAMQFAAPRPFGPDEH